MNNRLLLLCGSVAACVVTVALVVAQQRELTTLRAQQQEWPSQPPESAATPDTVSNQLPATQTENHAPSIALLKLRGEIGQLERRKRELADADKENARLRTQIVTQLPNGPGGIKLLPGFVRKSEAKFLGYDSPENTLQTLLWAIQNRDTDRFVQAFDPEMASRMKAEIQQRSPGDFFKEANVLPGLRIVGRESGEEDTVTLKVEMIPGDETDSRSIQFKRFEGQWRLISGL